jgi:hypothetical protein
MNYQLLKQEIVDDPLSQGYSAFLPDSTGWVANILNERKFQAFKTRMVTARGIMASYGIGPTQGALFLDKLESLSANIPALKWAMKFLQQETGLDVGEPATQIMLTSLIGVGGITQAEVDGVKAMAIQPASRAEVLFGSDVIVTEHDVIKAMEV